MAALEQRTGAWKNSARGPGDSQEVVPTTVAVYHESSPGLVQSQGPRVGSGGGAVRPPEGTQGKTLSHHEGPADVEPGEQAFSEAGEVQRKEEGPQEPSDNVMVGGRPAPRPRPWASLCSCTTRGGLGTAPALLALARAHATAVPREMGRCPQAAAQDEPAVNVREEQAGAVHQQGPPQRRSRDLGRRLSWYKGPGATGRPACGNCTGGRGGGEKGALVGR